MRTHFSAAQLTEPRNVAAEAEIRRCVHCGFCLASCPTYELLGDELDSPRGRIYLMRDMLEQRRQPTATVVRHIDRCLSCLACQSGCPSNVNYMHLIDEARHYIDQHYRRPFSERVLRWLLAAILPHRRRFGIALCLGRWLKPCANLLARIKALQPLAAMLRLIPARPALPAAHTVMGAAGASAGASSADTGAAAMRGRVALLQGCAEPVLNPSIAAATTRLMQRMGYEVVRTRRSGCCGALEHHLGRSEPALDAARRNIDAWDAEFGTNLAALIITAAGCGTQVKDYGYLLRHDADYAARAARWSTLARDATEFIAAAGLPAVPASSAARVRVAYHPPCSLQHGQRITEQPRQLLQAAGFDVALPPNAHLCCGSAGTYNILQPQIAAELGQRKARELAALSAPIIATGNIGCATQLAQHSALPIVHTVELLDWATGGPKPPSLQFLNVT